MDDALQVRLLRDPHVMIATDGSGGSQHPRGFGAFAKVIRRFVVEERTLSIEQAVHKMTGLPATTTRLGEQRRGLLRAGWAADIVVFAPNEVRDRASYEAPQQLAAGMRWIFTNGVAAMADGKLSGRRGGQLLLRVGANASDPP
jgi:N-acyl-D-amino-acid deacylase